MHSGLFLNTILDRNMISNNKLKQIFERTKGHCHFCGDPLVFDKYGLKNIDNIDGSWEIDHIIQRGKGGSKDITNCLPSCVKCNRLRWHRKGENLRELIFLGLIAFDEIKKKTDLGNKMLKIKEKRVELNKKRRCNIK